MIGQRRLPPMTVRNVPNGEGRRVARVFDLAAMIQPGGCPSVVMVVRKSQVAHPGRG